MKKATIDFTGCKYLVELHQRIQEALDFPDYYGKNLDAFGDCISCDCDVDFISIVGSKSIAADLKSTVAEILNMLEENKREWANTDCPFDYEIVS